MYTTAQDVAASYNRMLLNIYSGENSEYASLEDYLEGLAINPEYVQQRKYVRGRLVEQYDTGISFVLSGGGPTVWLNTADGMLYASDNGNCAGVGLFSEVRDEINDIFGIEY